MMNQKDNYLRQMGIIRWQLRNPAVLRGEVALTVPQEVRLLLVAQEPVRLDEPLIADVLRALQLSAGQLLLVDYARLAMLDGVRPCNSWWLGVQALPLAGAQLISPSLALLRRSAAARCALWQQICEHEHDFFA